MQKKRKFRLSEEEFKLYYSKVPKLAVEIVVVKEKGVVLTLRQHESWNNMWHIPGVTLYYGEKVEEAVHRAAREELGVEVEIKEFLGYLQFENEKEERGFGWSVTLDFLCTPLADLPENNMEGEEIRVFDSLPDNLVSQHRSLLEKVLVDLKKK